MKIDRRWATTVALSLSLSVGLARVGPNLDDLARKMAENVLGLAETILHDLGGSQEGLILLEDTRELGQSVAEFREIVRGGRDQFAMRRSFTEIDQTWAHLKFEIGRRGSTPDIDRSVQGNDRIELSLRQAIGLRDAPGDLFARPPLPASDLEAARRDVRALHAQAEALVESMRAGLGNYANRDHGLQDAGQLIERTQRFKDFLAQNPSPRRVQAAYASINDVANCLHSDFSQQAPPPQVIQAYQGFSRSRGAVHTALHMPTPAPVVEFVQPPAPGLTEARRIGFVLHDRAEALVATMRTQLGDHPHRDHVVQDVEQLAERTERFEQVLGQNPSPEQISEAYAPISQVTTCLQGDLTREPAPARVMQGWNAFTQAQYLIHQSLKFAPPPPTATVLLVPQQDARSPVIGMADQLVERVDTFLASFSPTAKTLPEGERFLVDAQRLRQASLQFREECNRGFAVGRLASQFREVDVCWNRLTRRINRVSDGRMGVNIWSAVQIGESCRDIHQVLAMPGDSPVLQGASFRPEGR